MNVVRSEYFEVMFFPSHMTSKIKFSCCLRKRNRSTKFQPFPRLLYANLPKWYFAVTQSHHVIYNKCLFLAYEPWWFWVVFSSDLVLSNFMSISLLISETIHFNDRGLKRPVTGQCEASNNRKNQQKNCRAALAITTLGWNFC